MPYKYAIKTTKVPYFFEDSASIQWWNDDFGLEKYLGYKGIKVFAFHPFCVFLNMESALRLQEGKKYFKDFKNLQTCVNTEVYGVKDFLIDILKSTKCS